MSQVRDVLYVLTGLGVAVLAAGQVLYLARRPEDQVVAPRSAPAAPARAAPSEPAPVEPVAAVARAVPKEILATSTVVAAGTAPGLVLLEVSITPAWEDRRARILDRVSGDVRAYAIGDLLPHGSLLVGLSTGSADLMVGDRQLVRMFVDGRVLPIEDFSRAFAGRALEPAEDLDPEYADQVRVALAELRRDDPAVVQAAIDRLIAAGDPAIELLIPHVDSSVVVHAATYHFPAGAGFSARPRSLSVIVMLVLERISGQTFGDLRKEPLADEERAQAARAWQRWWGAR